MTTMCDKCLMISKSSKPRTEYGVTTHSRYCDDCFSPNQHYYTAHDEMMGIPEKVEEAYQKQSCTVHIQYTIPNYRIAEVLETAIEAGISYWATTKIPKEQNLLELNKEWSLIIHEIEDNKIHIITLHDLHQALHIMAKEYTTYLQLIIHKDEDAEVADVLFQLAVFKELKYN